MSKPRVIAAAVLCAVVLALGAITLLEPSATASGCAITVKHWEVTQATQKDPRPQTAPLDLVGNRRTAVRVYAQDNCAQQVVGYLRVSRPGSAHNGVAVRSLNSIDLPVSVSSIVRDEEPHTLNFEVEPGKFKVGEATKLEVRVLTGDMQLTWDTNDGYHLVFPEKQIGPYFLGIPVDYQYDEALAEHKGVPNWIRTLPGVSDTMLWATWPFAESGHYQVRNKALYWPDEVVTEPQLDALARALRDEGDALCPRPDYVYGWMREPPGAYKGWSPYMSYAGWGHTQADWLAKTFAHEVGHGMADIEDYEMGSAGKTDESGWDVGLSVGDGWGGIGPHVQESFELVMMDPGKGDATRWITPGSWEQMLDKVSRLPDPIPINRCPWFRSQTISDTLLVDVQYDSGTSSWSLGKAVSSDTGPWVITPTVQGAGELRVLDPVSTTLFSTKFDATYNEAGNIVKRAVVETPWYTNSHKIELIWNGQLQDSSTRSANPPQVTITSPSPGSAITDTTVVSWTSSDLDDDPLYTIVDYLPDDGVQVIPLALGITATQLALADYDLPATDSGIIRVRVSDGFNTSTASVASLTNGPNHAPLAVIYQPNDGSTEGTGSGVRLLGKGIDLEDQLLPDANLVWSSNIDGVLGSGSVLQVFLSAGTHVITLTATDLDGAIGTAVSLMEVQQQ